MYRSVPFNFLALPDGLSNYATARAAIMPIPYDLTLTHEPGARLGPMAIITASRQLETFDEELGRDPSVVGIATLPELEPNASGPESMTMDVCEACSRVLADGKFVLALGGEHSMTVGLVKAHLGKYHDLGVVYVDAHTDLRDVYQQSPYSHACVLARIAEMAPFVSVGVRSFSGAENEKKHRSRIVKADEFKASRDLLTKKLALIPQNAYMTIDLDVFDPSVMPAVGTPEPGGLLWEDVMWIVRTVAESKNIVGADVTELSPRAGLACADFTAAKLAYKIIAWALR